MVAVLDHGRKGRHTCQTEGRYIRTAAILAAIMSKWYCGCITLLLEEEVEGWLVACGNFYSPPLVLGLQRLMSTSMITGLIRLVLAKGYE